MADLSDYDPYVDHELNHYRHTSDVDTGLLSPGLNAEKAEVKYVKEVSSCGFSPLGLRPICICLHLLLVLIHLGLIVVWLDLVDNKVVVPLSRSGKISSVIVVISQILATVCERPVSTEILLRWYPNRDRYTLLCWSVLPNDWPSEAWFSNVKHLRQLTTNPLLGPVSDLRC